MQQYVPRRQFNQAQFNQQQPIIIRPPRPKVKRRFRWELLLVPLAILFAFWFLGAIATPTFTWQGVMDAIGVKNKPRYTMLAVLGVTVTAIVAIARILGWGRKEKE